MVNELTERAKQQGTVRADITGTDLVFIQIGLIGIAETAHEARNPRIREDVEELHRRYLWLMLDGIRTHPHRASALPVAPLTTEQTHQLLAQAPRV